MIIERFCQWLAEILQSFCGKEYEGDEGDEEYEGDGGPDKWR